MARKRVPRREPREWFYSFPHGDRIHTLRIRRFYENPAALTVEIFQGGALELRIPWNMTKEEAERRAREKGDWIRKMQSKIPDLAGFPPPPLCRYLEGEEHPYLGRSYPLKLCKASRKNFLFQDGALLLELPSPERPEKVQELLWEFYRQEAFRFCETYFRKHLPRFKARGMRQKVEIRIRRLTGSWGRCGCHAGKISMNLFLAACPEVCIEGVMVHELCHLLHPNHSPSFYAFFDSMLPDWRERWKLLRGVSLSAISRKYPR